MHVCWNQKINQYTSGLNNERKILTFDKIINRSISFGKTTNFKNKLKTIYAEFKKNVPQSIYHLL